MRSAEAVSSKLNRSIISAEQDGGQRVGDVLAGDVRGVAVDGLIEVFLALGQARPTAAC